MNADAPGAQPLIVFRGPVTVHSGRGAATLLLRGYEASGPDRRGREHTEFVFAAAQTPALPAVLRDARVFGPAPGPGSGDALRRYRIEAGINWSAEVLARSVQLHRARARAFFGAVPPPRLSLSRRLGWLVLLSVLRLPGAARIVERIRGTT